MDLTQPVYRLDPHTDLHADAAHMREIGKIIPIMLPDEVPCWAVTDDATARALMRDADTFRKDPNTWTAWRRGEIPQNWPLRGFIDPGPSLVTKDGPDHTRLREPLAKVFTETRVRALQPKIEAIVGKLLDRLADAADQTDNRVVDFKVLVAWPLPMTVIGDMLGLRQNDHTHLRRLYDTWFDDTQDSTTAIEAIYAFITQLLAEKRHLPGDDLISALLALPEHQQLTDEELRATIHMLIAAGHDTTVHLLINGILNLTANPDQLALLLNGEPHWDKAVEETMRYDPPTANFPMRYAERDVEVAGVTIRAGEPVIISYIAMGRDTERFGDTADTFDLRRRRGHTSFGHGAHSCIGAPLARLEGRIALEAIFTRWPNLEIAQAPSRFPSVVMNAHNELLLRLPPGRTDTVA